MSSPSSIEHIETPPLSSSNSISSNSSPESFPLDDHSQVFISIKTHSFSGIPFSWEKLPGIPKKQLSKRLQDPSLSLLPLPPSIGTPTTTQKKSYMDKSFRKDPFFVAMVECSKGDDDDDYRSGYFRKGSAKVSRSLSNRFGFVSMYSSCKGNCPVSNSVLYIPKSRKHYILNRPTAKFN